MVAGPLVAVVNAQAQAGIASVDLMRKVAFEANGAAKKLPFTFQQMNTTSGTEQTNEVVFPALAILPLPFQQVMHGVSAIRCTPLALVWPCCGWHFMVLACVAAALCAHVVA